MSKLTKHLLQCNSEDCKEVFYVLNSAESEKAPTFCPFCGSPDIADFVPPAVVKTDDDEEDE